jgi:hypothetical protein
VRGTPGVDLHLGVRVRDGMTAGRETAEEKPLGQGDVAAHDPASGSVSGSLPQYQPGGARSGSMS